MARWSRKVSRSVGIDHTMQGQGTAPGDQTAAGDRLMVPPLQTVEGNRYLFLLAGLDVPESLCGRFRIRGLKQGLWLVKSLEAANGNTIYKWMPVGDAAGGGDPHFRFPDGNVSWHLYRTAGNVVPNTLRVGPQPVQGIESIQFRFATSPCLLYETITIPALDPFYVDLSDYLPPRQGVPFDEPVDAGMLKEWFSIEHPLSDPEGEKCLSILCEQPGFYGLYASVLQTSGENYADPSPPSPFYPLGMSREDQFLQNYPTGVTFGAVSGALYYELDEE